MASIKDIDPNELFNVEQPFNKPSGELPYALYNPETQGKLWWFCSSAEDEEEKGILSMYLFEHEPGKREKDCAFLKDLDEAKYYRDGLLAAGWVVPKMPEIVFKYADAKEELKKGPNRKERRRLEKQNKKK